MNISEIQVDQFGVWRNLNLPLSPNGLTVLHGPNEAGKTTLLRFLRGMLYGWRGHEGPAGTSGPNLRAAGALQLLSGHSGYRLQRDASSGVRGELKLSGRTEQRTAQEVLDDCLKGIPEQVYQNVFAIGLRELQELGTLDDRQVSELIYGLTLGVEGQRLLGAWNGVREERGQYLDPGTGTGLLAELQAEHDRLEVKLQEQHGHMAERHEKLAGRRDTIEGETASCRERQQGIQSQLRGHQFLDRVYGPWSRGQECRAELKQMPDIGYFPSDGVERMRKLVAERTTVEQSRVKLRAEISQLRDKATRLAGKPEIHKHVGALHGFILQRNWLRDLEQRISEANDRVELSRMEFDTRLERLTGRWSVSDIDQADVSAVTEHRLNDAARSYRLVLEKQAAGKRGYKRLKQTCQKLKATLDAEAGKLEGMTLDEAHSQHQRQYEDLKSLANLRVREAELKQRQEGFEMQLAHLRPRHVLPAWVYLVLVVFCVAGGTLGFWGIVKGITSSEIAGMTYLLLGLTTAGVAWGVKNQFEGDALTMLRNLEADAASNETELEATRRAIQQLLSQCDLSDLEDVQIPDLTSASNPPRAETRARPTVPNLARRTRRSSIEIPGASQPAETTSADSNEVQTDDSAPRNPADPMADAWQSVREKARVLGKKMWKATRESVLGFEARSSTLDKLENAPTPETEATIPPPVSETRGLGRRLAVPRSSSGSEITRHEGERSIPEVPRFVKQATEPAWELAAMQHVANSVAKFDDLRRSQQSWQNRRARLEERRQKLAEQHQELEATQVKWRELLAGLNLPEDLTPQQAAKHCEALVAAKSQRERVQHAEAELTQLKSLWNSFQQRIEELGRKLHWDADYRNPLHVLDRWEAQLTTWSKEQQERKEIIKQYRGRRQERSKLARQLKSLDVHRNALLVQGGAGDVEEFEERARSVIHRRDLEQQFDEAQAKLAEICAEHQDLAVVEEDLKAFNPKHNTEFMATLRQELHDLDRDLATNAEQLGGVRREMQLLEEDREPTRLRFEQAQVAGKLAVATSEWLALEAACQTIDEMRTKFERSCQPRTLAMASRLFNRMTRGRFSNIWTPLDRRELRIEDDRQANYTVEQLSCGTREQLFLAVRLALVEDLARQGIALPMVLDDVFVNFDEQRAEAAADVLLEFANQGHQVLFFTCHKHLADIFAARGVSLVELPARESTSDAETLRLRAG